MIKLPKIINKILICALLVWCIVISPIYFVGCWAFVAFSAFCEILSFDFNITLTRQWMREMQTFKEYIKDLKDVLEQFGKSLNHNGDGNK